MAEDVPVSGFRNKAAVCILHAFRDGDHAAAVLPVNPVHILPEFLYAEGNFRKVNQVRTCSRIRGQGCGSGQPAGVAAHDFHNGDASLVVHAEVLVNFHAGGSDKFGGGAEAGAVVRAVKVIVNGFGDSDDAAFITGLLHEFGYLVAGIHGIVAPVVEKVAYVVFSEYFQQTAVIRIIHGWGCHLVAAGTQGRCRGIFEQFQFSGVFPSHIEQAFFEHSLNPVGGSQHARDLFALQGGLNGSQRTGVDDGGGATGLADDACSFQWVHGQ